MYVNNDIIVNVDTTELIEILVRNRNTHEREFKESMEGYFVKAKRDALALLKAIDERTESTISLVMPKPRSYVKEYNDTIEMLRLSVDKTIQLDMANFRKLVKDEWEWKTNFESIKTAYMM